MAYRLTHPDSGLEIEREAEDVAMYESQGWQTSPHATPPPVEDDE